MDREKRTVEAALFMATEPLSLERISRIANLKSAVRARELLNELQDEYRDRAMDIVQGPNGWDMRVKDELLPAVAHLTPYADMSEGCKRTLALVVYREPIHQSEVIQVQGNKAYSYIRQLLRMGLIKAEKQGRTKVLSLTREFENYFGEEKEKIKERLEAQLAHRKRKPAPEEEILREMKEEKPEETPAEEKKKSLEEQLKDAENALGLAPDKSGEKAPEKVSHRDDEEII